MNLACVITYNYLNKCLSHWILLSLNSFMSIICFLNIFMKISGSHYIQAYTVISYIHLFIICWKSPSKFCLSYLLLIPPFELTYWRLLTSVSDGFFGKEVGCFCFGCSKPKCEEWRGWARLPLRQRTSETASSDTWHSAFVSTHFGALRRILDLGDLLPPGKSYWWIELNPIVLVGKPNMVL